VANANPNKITGIYKIASPSGKVYIGQTFDVSKRWGQYRNGYSKKQAKLHASFKKYGVDAHEFSLLCDLPSDTHQVIMDRHEQFFMDLYRAAGYMLLNLKQAGSSGRHSPLTREKMRGKLGKWMIGRKLDPETIAKRTAKQKGMTRSDETRNKLAASKRGSKNPHYGKHPWNYGMKGFYPLNDEALQRRTASYKATIAQRRARSAE
jgi:group I intron endonuclease